MHDIFWLLQSGCNLVSVPKGPQDWMCGILNYTQAAMASSLEVASTVVAAITAMPEHRNAIFC